MAIPNKTPKYLGGLFLLGLAYDYQPLTTPSLNWALASASTSSD